MAIGNTLGNSIADKAQQLRTLITRFTPENVTIGFLRILLDTFPNLRAARSNRAGVTNYPFSCRRNAIQLSARTLHEIAINNPQVPIHPPQS